MYFRKGGATAEADVFLNYPAENTNAYNGWKYVEATGTATDFTFTLDYSLLTSPVTDGDSIAYFVLAQDVNGNTGKKAVSFPAGFCPSSVNLPATGAVPTAASLGYKISAATASYTTIADGEWNSAGTWSCGVVPPTNANTVTIAHNITVSNTGNVGGNTTINTGASLTINTGGVLTLGNTGGGKINFTDNGTLTVNGGVLNVNGSMLVVNAANLLQSGGIISIDGNAGGVAANSVASGTPILAIGTATTNYSTGNISLTGGTLLIVDPHAATTATTVLTYYGASASNTITTGANHIFQIGDGASTDPGGSSGGFIINQWEVAGGFNPNLVINAPAGTNRVVNSNYSPFLVQDLTILNGQFTAPATCMVSGNLTVNNPGMLLSTGNMALSDGSFTAASIDMVMSAKAQAISGNGTIKNAASSPTASFVNLLTNNNSSSGITLNTPIQVSGTLTMTAGVIHTTMTSLLTLGTGATATTAGTLSYTGGIINGPFKKWIRNAAATYQLPVGTASNLENVSLQFTTAPATGGTITARWHTDAPDFPNGTPLSENSLVVDKASNMGYWSIDTGNNLAGGIYTATFTATGANDVIDYTKTVLLKRPGAGGDWTLNGTHVTTTGSNAAPVLSRTGMTGFSQFAIGGQDDVALPIGIVYFRGKKQGKTNVLDWKVNSPQTISMTLERGADSKKFEAIYDENVDGKTCDNGYGYTDISPYAGSNYYRLKVTQPGGAIKYSDIILLSNNDNAFDLVSLRPNPVTASAVLVVNAVKAAAIHILITDMAGRMVLQQNTSINAGETSLNLDFSNLASGSYNMTTINGIGTSKTIRFVKH